MDAHNIFQNSFKLSLQNATSRRITEGNENLKQVLEFSLSFIKLQHLHINCYEKIAT